MIETAMAMHRRAWESLIQAAEDGSSPARNAIYTSGTLSVRHPEVYLLGAAWFVEGARTIKGFKECYEDPTPLGWCHMEYGHTFFGQSAPAPGLKTGGYTGISEGSELSLASIDLSKYRLTDAMRIYPEPFSPWIDQRLVPLPVALKTEGRVVSCLELAVMYFFQARERLAAGEPHYILYCDDEEAYIYSPDGLFSARANTAVQRPSGNPILIFDDESVWYPLMKRDDTGSSSALAHLVSKYATTTTRPSMDEWEAAQVKKMETASAFQTEDQKHLAALAAMRANGWSFHPFARAWSRFVPDSDFTLDISRRLCIVREFDRLANSVSPATAHLCSLAQASGPTMEEKMRTLSSRYLRYTGLVRDKAARGWKPEWRLEAWGHLWPCGLMEHTIDDAFRSRTGHCVSQAHMIAAVLEMADVPHIVVNFDRGGVMEGVNHHFLLTSDGFVLFDDGLVNIRGVDAATEDYGPLISFSMGGDWASTVGDKLFSNVSVDRVAEIVDLVDVALAGRFPLTFYRDEASKDVANKNEFLELLHTKTLECISIP